MAWGCALWSASADAIIVVSRDLGRDIADEINFTPEPNVAYIYSVGEGIGVMTVVITGRLPADLPILGNCGSALLAGWPMRCLQGYRSGAGDLTNAVHAYTWLRPRGFQTPWLAVSTPTGTIPAEPFRIVPFRVILPGFLIDTLFYATIWGGMFFGFASAKRAIRRARGRCPMCGYDLRGALDKGCSECGWQRRENSG
jgi:hypothetical protein